MSDSGVKDGNAVRSAMTMLPHGARLRLRGRMGGRQGVCQERESTDFADPQAISASLILYFDALWPCPAFLSATFDCLCCVGAPNRKSCESRRSALAQKKLGRPRSCRQYYERLEVIARRRLA